MASTLTSAVGNCVPFFTRSKWSLFRAIERANELLRRKTSIQVRVPGPAWGRAPLWLYASTLGELNAVEPLLRALLDAMDQPPLLIFTDRAHYRESFLARYPDACVRVLDRENAVALANQQRPRLLVLAEIPCGLSDAPCRFPFGVLYELKRRGVPVCAVNGWLYGGAPACRLDAIEKRLFARDYLRLFDLITTQDENIRSALIAAGADAQRVIVTGNTKFDAPSDFAWQPRNARSPVALRSIIGGVRPVIVAGCVTNIAEQILVLDAFVELRRSRPETLLIIAPRHPEVEERMNKLRAMLTERKLSYAFRSQCGDVALPGALDCFVLDTLGELKDFYAAGTIAYVGLNHNILEPLLFGKPVVVTPGWEASYPSYPMYRRLVDEELILEVGPALLAGTWLELLRDPAAQTQTVQHSLASLRGATGRNLALMRERGWIDTPARTRSAAPAAGTVHIGVQPSAAHEVGGLAANMAASQPISAEEILPAPGTPTYEDERGLRH